MSSLRVRSPFLAFVLVATTAISGCLTVSDRSDVNIPVPKYFSDRDFIEKGIAETHGAIDFWAGRVAFGAAGNYTFLPKALYKDGTKLSVVAVESAYFYSSVIDSKYAGDVSIAIITVESSDDYSRQYEIRDAANVVVPRESEPTRGEVQAAADKEKIPRNSPLWWVSSVVLTNVRESRARKISTSGTITGTGFGANGNIYNAAQNATWYPMVSIYVLPMNSAADDAAKRPRGDQLSESESRRLLGVGVQSRSGLPQPLTLKISRGELSPVPSRLSRDREGKLKIKVMAE